MKMYCLRYRSDSNALCILVGMVFPAGTTATPRKGHPEASNLEQSRAIQNKPLLWDAAIQKNPNRFFFFFYPTVMDILAFMELGLELEQKHNSFACISAKVRVVLCQADLCCRKVQAGKPNPHHSRKKKTFAFHTDGVVVVICSFFNVYVSGSLFYSRHKNWVRSVLLEGINRWKISWNFHEIPRRVSKMIGVKGGELQ